MNFGLPIFFARSPRRAAQSRSSRLCAALLFLLLSFVTSQAAQMRFGPYTNYDGALLTNFQIIVQPVGDPAIDAAGNAAAMNGLPKRLTIGADGMLTNAFQNQNYRVLNAPPTPNFFTANGYMFRAPLDSGPTIYSTTAPGIFITGMNYFVTLALSNGTVASITYNVVTNALGFAPAPFSVTNGLIAKVDGTNISTFISGVYSNSLFTDYTTKIAVLSALSLTNAFATNAAGVIQANGRIYISTNYESTGAALAAFQAGSNYTVSVSNSLAGQIVIGSVTAVTVTNIATNQVFKGTNTISVASGLSAFAPTNQFDPAGTALAIGLQSTNFTLATSTALSNALQIQIGAAGISAITATNISTNQVFLGTNTISIASGLSAFVSTNRFDVAGAALASTNGFSLLVFTSPSQVLLTNRLPALTNGFVDKSITNNAATVAQLNVKANTNAPTIWTPVLIGGGSTNQGLTNANIYGILNADSGLISTFGSLLIKGTDGGDILFGAGGLSDPDFQLGMEGNDGNFYFNSLKGGVFSFSGSVSGDFFSGNGFGLINTSTTNLVGTAKTQVTNIVNALSTGATIAITNAYGTNLPNGLVVGQRIYFPTNFDAAGGSNFLYATKLGKTNDTSYSQTATNLSIQGNVNMGRDGASTVFIAGTNFLAFNNAGSGLVTNGSFVWVAALGEYTNFLNGAELSNNTSSWVLKTNSVTLYSLSGANPLGTYSAINGALPAPTSVFTEAANDHLTLLGYFSVTNLNTIFAGLTNIIVITSNGAIAVSSGTGNNTTLNFTNANWGKSNSIPSNTTRSGIFAIAGASNSVDAAYSGDIGGFGNLITSGGSFNFIWGGYSNNLTETALSTISGGAFNKINVSNYGFISGGQSNRIFGNGSTTATYNTILGGFGNSILLPSGGALDFSTILGGTSNTISASGATAGGSDVTLSNANTFGWSDGTALNSTTNSQVSFYAGNGYRFLGGAAQFDGNVTASGFTTGGKPLVANASTIPFTNSSAAGILSTNLGDAANTNLVYSDIKGGMHRATIGTGLNWDAPSQTLSSTGGGGGSGTVTSVAATVPSGYTVSGSPVTTSGTLAITRTADVNNLGFGQTNMAFLKVTNTASIGGQTFISSLILTNGFTNQALTASTDLEADANKQIISLANAAGVKTNSGSGSGWNAAPQFNGVNVTNLNVFDSLTNAFSGNNFTLGQSTAVRGSSDINLSGLANTPAFGLKRYGELVVVATGDLQITNPVSFHASDGLFTRTLTNGASASIAVDVQVGLRTNMAIVILPP